MAVHVPHAPDGHQSPTHGGGIAVVDLDGDGRPELVVFHIDSPPGHNHGYYRVGRFVDTPEGIAQRWGDWTLVPGWTQWENQGGSIAVTDLDGDGRPELVVFQIDNPPGQNAGFYKIGWKLDGDGAVTGGWSGWIPVPGWEAFENQGGAIAIADLNGDGRPELVVFQIDNPPGQNGGYYKVGWTLDAAGMVTGGWTGWIPVPGWYAWENQGCGIAVADLDGDGRPELVVFQIDNPAQQNTGSYKIGRTLDVNGIVTAGWTDWIPVPGWTQWENLGGGIALADGNGDGQPELVVFQLDNPPGQSLPLYKVGWGLDAAGVATGGWTEWFPVTAAPEDKGAWEVLPYNTPVLPIHAALLHTGKVFFFAGSSNDPDNFNAHDFKSVVWDYTAGTFHHPQTPIDFFCCGHAYLPDGRLLVAGGTLAYDPFHGLRDTFIFDPITEQWTAVPFMAGGRWYPTLVTLADGRVLAISGLGEDGNLNLVPEVFALPEGWQALPQSGNWPMYAHLYLMGDGRLFYPGGQYGSPFGMRPSLIEPATGAATEVPGLSVPDQRNQCASVLLPPAQDQRVMIIAGGSDYTHVAPMVATDHVDVVDLAAGHPAYAAAAPLNFARVHLNAVLLPDRTVLVTGGSREEETAHLATLDAEIYDPATNTWSIAARATVVRLYHSIAILLPDGRVVTAGSNPVRKDEELRLEIYSPPYLFKGARPVIADVAQELRYGETVVLQTAQAEAIQWVSLIKPSSSTHSLNTDQRLVDLAFTVASAASLAVTVVKEPTLAPPGWYMLFITDQQGVPSVASWVHVV